MIFRHSGVHFSNEDVKGISRVGSRESNKDRDIEKTGYKGIGFKSVFGSSEYVQIVSNNYSFRFDRNYSVWKERNDYPWQVIPIWTNESPSEISSFLDKDYVNTIIQISNKDRIRDEIEKVFEDCQIVLFLRHVRRISFFDNESIVFKIEKRENKDNVRQLFKNGILLSSWIIKDFIVPVSEEVQQKLRKLSDEECPPKLKEAKNTKITFAGFVKNQKILQVEDALMYCYLPTKVCEGFPYIINADFITNAERTQFLDNDWNVFLYDEIGYRQFEWLKELQKTSLKFQIAALIKSKFSGYRISTIKESFNAGFDEGIEEISFLPERGTNNLLKVENSIIDTTGFSEQFGTTIISSFLNTQSKVIDPRIENPNLLIEIGVAEFSIEELVSLISSDFFKKQGGLNPQKNIQLITIFL